MDPEFGRDDLAILAGETELNVPLKEKLLSVLNIPLVDCVPKGSYYSISHRNSTADALHGLTSPHIQLQPVISCDTRAFRSR